jgi:NADH-ubiquinone oxidoreductase chain 2
MPKISILIFLLELQTHLGFIDNSNIYSIFNLDFFNSISSINSTINSINSINSISSINIFNGYSIAYLLKTLLLISSLLSLIIGTIVGLAQNRIKRLLAYSTISHIGFILLALAINTEQSIDSLIFYIIQYSITNLNVFLIIIAIGYIINNSNTQVIRQDAHNLNDIYFIKKIDSDIKFINQLKGLFFNNPLLSLSLSISLFSMAGIFCSMPFN